MLLYPGQKKALCTLLMTPMEPWTGERTEPANSRNGGCGLIPNKMENCSCHFLNSTQHGIWGRIPNNWEWQTKPPTVSSTESGEGFQTIGKCRLNHQQFPMWNLGAESKGRVFYYIGSNPEMLLCPGNCLLGRNSANSIGLQAKLSTSSS